nr:hypothetical protein [Anaerolineales bacterium]
ERAKRAAESQKKALYESLGVKDDAEFDAYLKAKQEAEDKQKTETERLADQAKKAQDALDKNKSESDAKLAEMQKRIVDSEIKILASADAKDKDGKVTRTAFRPEALNDIPLLIDRSKIEEREGVITGIDTALAELAKAKPWLLADEAPPPGKGTPRSGGRFSKTSEKRENDKPMFNSL